MADFQDYKYETDSGILMLIKMDTATAAQAGTAPTGPIQLSAHAIQSRSRKAAGVHCRKMNLSRQVGTAPNTFNKYKHIPLVTPAAYTAAAGLIGTTINIGSQSWTVTSLTPEKAV